MKQKTTLTRSRWLLACLLSLLMTLGGSSPAWAQTFTLYGEETAQCNQMPIYGYYNDYYTKSEFIIPASDLSSISGKELTAMTFYASQTTTPNGTYQFFLKEVNVTTLTGFLGNDGATTVYSGTVSINSSKELKITFSSAYSYQGGNLLVGCYTVTKGNNYPSNYFLAKSVTSAGWAGYNSSSLNSITGNTQAYIPRITFSYNVEGPALSVANGETTIASGYSYNFGLATAGTTKEFTLSNPGTEPAPITISHTGSFGVSPTSTSIPAGESVTLTVTMPETTGNDIVTISSTSDAIDDFVINVSGTVRDPVKLWCNFASGLPTGWTNSGNYTINTSGAGAGTSGGGYAGETSYTYRLMHTPLATFEEGEKLYLKVAGYSSSANYNELQIRYSSDGSNWTTAKTISNIAKGSWTDIEVSEIPAGNYYIGFYGHYVYFTDIYGGTESTAPVLSLSQSSYDFGLINENTTSAAITITNTGKSELTGMNLVSSNAAFTFNVTDAANTIAANGGTATFTVTMSSANAGAQNGIITIKSDNADDLVLNVSGAVAKAGTVTETFNNNQKPDRWTNSASPAWSFSDGKAVAPGSSYGVYSTLTTPKLSLLADDFLAIKVKANASSYGHLKVFTSTDGSTFSGTALKEVSYSELSTEDYKTIIVTGLTPLIKAIKFEGYQVTVDEIGGLTYAPVLVVKDAEDAVQASPVAYAFGEQGANASVTYSFTNGGAGTLNITNVAVTNTPDDGTYTTNWTESVATPFNLVITQNYDAEKAGAKTGSVVVTMSDASTFTINLSGTLLAANAPTLAVDNTLEFGKLTANDTQTVTVTNSGTGSMTVNIESNNALFTVSPAQLTEIGAGASKTFDVTFHYDQVTAGNYGVKNANITVTPTYNAEAAVVISASAKAKDPEEWGEDFAGNAKPDGWEVSATGSFTFANGIVSGHFSTSGTLTTPSLKIGSTTDAMSFKYKRSNAAIVIKKQKNGGEWTQLVRLPNSSYATDDEWQAYTITGLEAGNYKFQFTNDDYDLDDFEGFKLNADAPAFGYYTNSQCTAAAAATVTRDYGFVTEAPDAAVYYMKNDGTGTLNLTLGDVPTGFTAVLGKTSLAADESTTLTINMPIATKGYRGGNIVVTGKDSGDNTLGTFTVTASGVVEEDGKMNLNFATDNIPSAWTPNDWEKNNGGYVAVGYSSSTLETSKLSATAGEELVVVAKQSYSSNDYKFGVKYKKDGEDDWNDLIAEANIGTSYVTLHAPIAEAGDYYFRFTGRYTQIQRIYGLSMPLEPVMVVYDGENVAGATKNFGMVSDEADAVWTLTVKNEGQAKLEGLAAALSGEQAAHYAYEINGATGAGNDEIEAGAQATITIKQLKDNLGDHEATLTISATGLDDKVITLSGSTRDHTKLYVDFENNELPEGWRKSSNDWTVSYGTANNSSTTTASSLFTRPLAIANANDVLSFDAQKYGSTNVKDLTVRYTTNGGVTWTEYDWSNYAGTWDEGETVKDKLTGSMQTFEITGIPTGTVVFEFCGKYLRIDNIQANHTMTTAPLVAFTKVTDNISDANLTADAEATYTLANIGNANYVGTVAKSNVNVAIIGEDVTYEDNTLTIPAGKTAEITVTMPFAAPYGAKNGSMTITSESWVGDVAVNYTAKLINPDAINIDFASQPAGWYNAGWTVNGTANIYSGVEKEMISEQFAAEEGKNVLSFKAKAESGNEGTLKVYTSTDRKTWSEPTEFALTNEYATKNLAALDNGECYYVKFVSSNANIDDLTGLKKVTGIEHDLYVSASNIPAETKVPVTSITATATVYSLRADETGVYAKLFFDETVVATAAAQDISLNGSKTFELTGNVPATEKTYASKIVVYYSNDDVAFETATTNVEVQHTRTLAITSFTRTDGDGALDADVNNQVSPAFSVTVQNTGTTAGTPTVKIYQGENVVATGAAAAEVAAGATSDAIALTATNMSAGEGGDMAFTAKAFWTAEDPEAKATSASDIVITINAAAPKFALYDSEAAPVANETAYDYGLTRTKIDKVFTIKNEGTKTLQLTSIVAPTGFTATAVTNENKDIAVNGTLDITISLDPSEGLGKKNGNVVITYDVNGTPATFTLAVSGRSIAENTWVEQFDEGIPATWQNTGWTWNEDRKTAYSGGVEGTFTLMTPRLAAANAEVLTYETKWQYSGDNMTVQYSTDKTNWTDYETVTASTETVEHQFVAPAAGNYYLKFTANRYVNLDNFIGFTLNIPEHDMELTASDVPTTGKRLNSYVATVTLKENAGKNEEITAELWVNGAKVDATADVTSVEANSNATVVTLTWEPQSTLDAVNAYVKVTYAGGTLQTEPVSLTIADVYTLSETSSNAVEAVTNETIMLERSFVAGWNTVCLPFAVADNTAIESLFGEGTKVFNFKNFANNMIDFEAVTTMSAATPYLIYVPADITEPIRVNNVTISNLNTTAGTVWHNNITFHGSYAPVAAGSLAGKYGVTPSNQLAKGNANTTMKGFRGYFEGNLASARISIFDEATGISKVYAPADLFGDNDRVYNLGGQKVENAKKGVYIVNGHKVVVK